MQVFICGPHLEEAQLKAQLARSAAPSFELAGEPERGREGGGRERGFVELPGELEKTLKQNVLKCVGVVFVAKPK